VSATFIETLQFHDLSPFVSATFMICVHDFPRGEVSVKVGIMEFGLIHTFVISAHLPVGSLDHYVVCTTMLHLFFFVSFRISLSVIYC